MSVVDGLRNSINTELGVEYCGGDEDFYAEMLRDYVDGDKTELLNMYLEAENWTDYRIQIHAVKSTSLMIGAEELSGKAKELEMAAAAGDGAAVKAGHASVLNEYRKLMDLIKAALQ